MYLSSIYTLTTQSVILRLTSSPPGSSVEMQNIKPHADC